MRLKSGLAKRTTSLLAESLVSCNRSRPAATYCTANFSARNWLFESSNVAKETKFNRPSGLIITRVVESERICWIGVHIADEEHSDLQTVHPRPENRGPMSGTSGPALRCRLRCPEESSAQNLLIAARQLR